MLLNFLLNSVNCVLKIVLVKNGIKKNSIVFVVVCFIIKISNIKKVIIVCRIFNIFLFKI